MSARALGSMRLRAVAALLLAAACALPARGQASGVATARVAGADPYELLGAHAASADRWHEVGEALRAGGRHREAIGAYERALQLGVRAPHRAALAVARSYAALGNRRQAVRWVERAVELGLADRTQLASPELEGLRGDPRFRAAEGALTARRERPVAD